MGLTDTESILKELSDLSGFVKDRFDPVTKQVSILEEENKRLVKVVDEIKKAQDDIRRRAVGSVKEEEPGLRVQEGPYADFDALDVRIMAGFADTVVRENRVREARQQLVGQATPDRTMAIMDSIQRQAVAAKVPMAQRSRTIRPMMADYTRAAMDSTTAGSGDELVPTLESAQLWMDVNLETKVAALIPIFPMPGNPFDIPRQLGRMDFYPGTENVATTSTALGTGKATLTAYELVGQVPYSFTLEEDAVFSLLPEIRSGIVRNTAEILEDIILNADTDTLNNINADGATIAATDAGKGQWLIGYDGLIHLPLVDNASQANAHGSAATDDMFNEIRAKLGKYGVRPSELVWIMDVNTFIRVQVISQFRTMDKLGPNATLVTGMLGAVSGIPVVVSEQMLLTAADGKVTDGAAGTLGRLLIVNKTQWAQGYRRQMSVAVTRDEQKRQTVITLSLRHALTERTGARSSAEHTALQYNITVA